jgi:hypothetical protein
MRALPVLAALVAATAVATGGTAHADPVPTGGYLSLTSVPGDPVGGGVNREFSYEGEPATFDATTGNGQHSLRIRATSTTTGETWVLRFTAPPGGDLAFGDYPAATLGSATPGAVGLSVSSPTRTCAAVTGSVSVQEAQWSADGTLQIAMIGFVQYCDGAAAPLRGFVNVASAAFQEPLAPIVRIDPAGTVRTTGVTTVSGTIQCNRPSDALLRVTLGQGGAQGEKRFRTTCDAQPTPWTVRLRAGTGSFTAGAATAAVTGRVTRQSDGAFAAVAPTATVTLA